MRLRPYVKPEDCDHQDMDRGPLPGGDGGFGCSQCCNCDECAEIRADDLEALRESDPEEAAQIEKEFAS